MSNVITILNKILAKEFYRLNAGFFLLIGALTFGFMSEVEHKALAQFFVSSPYVLFIPVGVWIIYTFKILNFNRQQLTRFENKIVFNVAFLSSSQQALCISIFIMLQLLPAILYGVFLSYIAWSIAAYQSIMIILIAMTVLWLCSTTIIIWQLHKSHQEKKISFVKRLLDYQYPKPVIQFYIEWLLRRDPIMLAGTKIFAGVLVFGVCVLYASENYDWRLLAMSTTGGAVANLLIIFQIQDFENTHISWIKNLPLTIAKRFGRFLMVFTILLLPETAVLLKYFPDHLSFYWLILNFLYALSIGAFFFGLLHIKATSLENFTKKSFWIFIALILLILFKVPLIIISLMNFNAGFLLYRKYFYLFEPEARENH